MSYKLNEKDVDKDIIDQNRSDKNSNDDESINISSIHNQDEEMDHSELNFNDRLEDESLGRSPHNLQRNSTGPGNNFSSFKNDRGGGRNRVRNFNKNHHYKNS